MTGRGAVPFSLALLLLAPSLSAYSVLTHEAVIDSSWDRHIVPLLLARFPGAGPEELKQAHAYAYGGCIIQDMGYYPFGNKFFSDLVHYVRSADFVVNLIGDSGNLNEYAFSLGALAHYVSDSTGHPTINRAVATLYPKLRARYGSEVTFEDNPLAHMKMEFGFDVLQVAHGTYAPQAYRDFIGFDVAKPLLERSFAKTYGFELKDIFLSEDLVLGSYRFAVSKLIPETTRVAWHLRKDEIKKLQPGMTERKFRYRMSRASFRKEWGDAYRRPGFFARLLAGLLSLVPRFGPFRAMDFRPPTPAVEKMFMAAFTETGDRYWARLHESTGGLKLADLNLDIGQPTRLGRYRLADQAYAKLLHRLAGRDLAAVSPELRQNILAFFAEHAASGAGGRSPAASPTTQRELDQLKQTDAQLKANSVRPESRDAPPAGPD